MLHLATFQFLYHAVNPPSNLLHTLLHLHDNMFHILRLYHQPIHHPKIYYIYYISISICMNQSSLSISCMTTPKSFIYRTIWPELFTLSPSLMILPLTNIYCSVFELLYHIHFFTYDPNSIHSWNYLSVSASYLYSPSFANVLRTISFSMAGSLSYGFASSEFGP